MARRRKEKEVVPTTGDTSPFHQPFAGLAGLKASLPEGEASEVAATSDTTAQPPDAATPARAVIRRSRKGRGGREVTEISHLGLSSEALGTWARELRSQLGCGGAVEEDVIVLHGDQRDRVETLLKARGVQRITRG